MYDEIIKKYPKMKEDLDIAQSLQESSNSVTGRALYREKQALINGLIPELIENAKTWNENKLRYIITKLEILRDEIISMEHNSKAFDTLVEQIQNGDFDNQNTDDE